MERYDGSVAKRAVAYLGAELNPRGTAVSVNIMDNEAAPAFIVDQGLYYPSATGYYGYYCTGFEAAGDWDDNSRVLQLDNPDLHYSALQAESLPYVYYSPNHGYAQSAYNPFNPYIPGAIVGVDGQFVGTQPYCSSPPYQHTISSPSYFPIVFQRGSDNPSCSLPNNSLPNVPILSSSGLDGVGGTYAASASSTMVTIPDGPLKPGRDGENQTACIHPSASKGATFVATYSSMSRANIPDGPSSQSSEAGREGQRLQSMHVKPEPSEGAARQSASPETFSSTRISKSSSAPASIQARDYVPLRRMSLVQRSANMEATSAINGVGSSHHGWSMTNKSKASHCGMAVSNMDRSSDVSSEQNRGPRTSRIKNHWTSQLSLKVYSTQAVGSDTQENILIYADQYNRDDFPVSYPDAKFFVIKSYSEDDVHKSIKYNVWSSTPNGNKRLGAAYEDAQRRSGGKHRACPIFLFFSVNASGQFCGVAEMIGSVDFQKDMDFWQQDKWNGSFPVKWHLVKDVSNPNFRHIILENNENKPVTNSRDTQEVKYTQGIEMLKIFKNYTSKTSILDDFMYYEERQKALFERKTRYLNQVHHDLDSSVTNDKMLSQGYQDLDSSVTGNKVLNQGYHDLDSSVTNSKALFTVDQQTQLQVLPQTANDAKDTRIVPVQDVKNVSTTVKTSSLANEPIEDSSSNLSDIVTVGSMPIKVNGYTSAFSASVDEANGSDEKISVLTVGTISIDPKALKLGKHGSFATGNRSTC